MNNSKKKFVALLCAACVLVCGAVTKTRAALPESNAAANSPAGFGTIRGLVRDENDLPVAGAIIALFRDGASTVKQVRSATDGSFVARVAPGRYSLTAMAEGFSVVSLGNVEVERSEDIAFRFNLVRVGSGNTLPERRADRSNSKWRTRANQSRRTILQNVEGTGETAAKIERIETAPNTPNTNEKKDASSKAEYYAETFMATASGSGIYTGLNFATVQPVSEKFNFVVAGQTGTGANASQRLETGAKIKLNEAHRISLQIGGAKIGKIKFAGQNRELNQVSLRTTDEWRVRNDLILVLGFDYARFVGTGNAESIAPRFGLQFEANPRTRFTVGYTTQNEPRTWAEAAELEDSRVLFRETDSRSYAVSDADGGKQVLMPKLRRLEFGVERVLDNASSVEAAAFFDATENRGIAFTAVALPFAFADATSDDLQTTIQNGSAQGLRVVYARRLNSVLSANAGYAFGRGQVLSANAPTNPQNLFETAFFQTFAAQLAADFRSGTQVRAVYRYSPRSTVFALDPFAGRIAVYDPSLSIYVTQKLPTWGLPVRAKAIFDARNLFDLQTAVNNGESIVTLDAARRTLRGGIAVQF
jgi:hypothetical protein